MTRATNFRRLSISAAILAFAGSFALGSFAPPAQAQPRHYDHRYEHHDHGHWDQGRGYGYYAPPPVVYATPYYAPPPVVYTPGITFSAPGVSVNIR